MDNEQLKEVEEMEEKAKFTIITLDCDEGEEESKKVLDDAKECLKKLYEELYVWLKNHTDSEETQEKIEYVKQETTKLLSSTQDKLKEFNEREDVKEGKEKVKQSIQSLVAYMQAGIQEISKNDVVKNCTDTLTDTLHSIKEDEQVKSGVRKLKKGTLKVAESAFNGLKRVLDTETDDSRKG